MAGGKIKPPPIIEIISIVVAIGKPGVFSAIQLDVFGKIGPKNKPASGKTKNGVVFTKMVAIKGSKVSKIIFNTIFSAEKLLASQIPANLPVVKKR